MKSCCKCSLEITWRLTVTDEHLAQGPTLACRAEPLKGLLVCSVFLRQGLCVCPRLAMKTWPSYCQALGHAWVYGHVLLSPILNTFKEVGELGRWYS